MACSRENFTSIVKNVVFCNLYSFHKVRDAWLRSVHVGFVVDKVALGQVFPGILRFSLVSFFPPVLHYTEKRKKLIVFITGLHNKPQGCGASEASAAGPLKKKAF
jgi:hypothetical protein